MSPPARPVIHQAPPKATEAMSPPPPQSIPGTQESTQVASQILAYMAEEEYDPTVWGYLYPITDPTAKCIRLDKTPESPQEEVQEKGTKKKGKTGKASKATAAEKKKSPHGFLIGRHPECDEQIDAAVISNRHCVIYRELVGGKPKAILEDLSSNGTWVNKVIIGRNRRRELEDGDEVEFAGGHTYHFKYPTKIKVNGFHDDYQKGSSIGNGHFATVYRAIEKKTGDLYAVKIFKRKKTAESTASFETEVSHLMTISHPNLIAMKAHYVEDDGVYLILELLAGGELFNHIIKNQRLSENETRKIMKQLLSGLKYLVRTLFHPISSSNHY
jgi:serine/threonine-protein kinase Chk2